MLVSCPIIDTFQTPISKYVEFAREQAEDLQHIFFNTSQEQVTGRFSQKKLDNNGKNKFIDELNGSSSVLRKDSVYEFYITDTCNSMELLIFTLNVANTSLHPTISVSLKIALESGVMDNAIVSVEDFNNRLTKIMATQTVRRFVRTLEQTARDRRNNVKVQLKSPFCKIPD